MSSFSAPTTAHAVGSLRRCCVIWAAIRSRSGARALRRRKWIHRPSPPYRRKGSTQAIGIDTSGLEAKSLDQFIGRPVDYIVTVCDLVRDICPASPGNPAQAHWRIADPVVIEDPEERAKVFRQVVAELQIRIRYLLLLPPSEHG